MPIALLFLTLLADPKIDTTKERDKLQGRWLVTAHEVGGKKAAAKTIATMNLTVAGAEMTAREGTDLLSAYKFTLDPSATPKAIDLLVTEGDDKDKRVKGIYKVDGDTLSICVAEPDKERPLEFATKEGSGLMLFVFKKEKK